MKNLLLSTALLVVPIAAQAANIAFTFEAEVTQLNDGANAILPDIGGVVLGDAVSGSFMVDTSLIFGGSGASASYAGAVSSFGIDIDGHSYSSTLDGYLTVRDNHMAGSSAPLRDVFWAESNGVIGSALGGLTPSMFRFAMGSTDTSILSGVGMPSSSELFDLLANDTVGGSLAFLTFTDGSEVRFDVTSMTIDDVSVPAVPLPAGLPLLGLGLGALAMVRRKRNT